MKSALIIGLGLYQGGDSGNRQGNQPGGGQ